MKERCEKGLCYNCDECWHPGHKCKSPRLFLLSGLELQLDDTGEEVFYDSTKVVEPIPKFDVVECKEMEISLNVISSSARAKSMWLLGLLHNHQAGILVDSRNTYNFLDPVLLTRVQLHITSIPLLRVRI
jgi:hypothetical protein